MRPFSVFTVIALCLFSTQPSYAQENSTPQKRAKDKYVEKWIRALEYKDQDTLDRLKAVSVLERLKSPSIAASSALRRCLLDKNDEAIVRQSAASALGTLGKKWDTKATVKALEKGMSDKEWKTVCYCINALAQIAEKAKLASPSFFKALKHKHARVRSDAAFFLPSLNPPVKEATLHLIGRLNDRDKRVRRCAEYALKKLHPQLLKASKVASKKESPGRRLLQELRKHSDSAIQKGARAALQNIVKRRDED